MSVWFGFDRDHLHVRLTWNLFHDIKAKIFFGLTLLFIHLTAKCNFKRQITMQVFFLLLCIMLVVLIFVLDESMQPHAEIASAPAH